MKLETLLETGEFANEIIKLTFSEQLKYPLKIAEKIEKMVGVTEVRILNESSAITISDLIIVYEYHGLKMSSRFLERSIQVRNDFRMRTSGFNKSKLRLFTITSYGFEEFEKSLDHNIKRLWKHDRENLLDI